MQATPDIFLGWTRGPGGRDFYFRQLWDMKGSVDIDDARARRPRASTAGSAARSLARAHARSGDAVAIAAYLGTSDTFDGAIADFAEAYADQNAADHDAFARRSPPDGCRHRRDRRARCERGRTLLRRRRTPAADMIAPWSLVTAEPHSHVDRDGRVDAERRPPVPRRDLVVAEEPVERTVRSTSVRTSSVGATTRP